MSLFVNEVPILNDGTLVRSIALGTDVKIQLEEILDIPNMAAANATSQVVFICPKSEQVQITGIEASFGTASTSGTVTLEKLTGTQASGAGTALLTAPMSLSGAANTPVFGALISTISSLNLSNNGTLQDRLGLVFAGTVTNLVNCVIQIRFRRIA